MQQLVEHSRDDRVVSEQFDPVLPEEIAVSRMRPLLWAGISISGSRLEAVSGSSLLPSSPTILSECNSSEGTAEAFLHCVYHILLYRYCAGHGFLTCGFSAS